MPAEIGPAAASPSAAPTIAPHVPRIAASYVTNRLIWRPVAPRRRRSEKLRRRSVIFMSIALPTRKNAIALVRPVTKSSPRSAECSTSSAMLERPAGTSASNASGSLAATRASASGRDARGSSTTRTRSTRPSERDMSARAAISTMTPAPSANHFIDSPFARPTTVSLATLRRAKKITSSPITLPSPAASPASSTTSSGPTQARPAVSSSRPVSTREAASTPTVISRTRFSPTRSSVGR